MFYFIFGKKESKKLNSIMRESEDAFARDLYSQLQEEKSGLLESQESDRSNNAQDVSPLKQLDDVMHPKNLE